MSTNLRKLNFICFLAIIFFAGCARKPLLRIPFSRGMYPKKVALLLPLHGKYGKSGQAIRNGFLAAYYYALQHGQDKLTVALLDTSKKNASFLYEEAVKGGAEFIVGPLTKQNVLAVYNMRPLKVPTLALNTLDDHTSFGVRHLYQFGLYAQDEAYQVAMKAWSEHPGRALIITPAGKWGEKMAQVLRGVWTKFGGDVAGEVDYKSQQLEGQIAHALNIDLSRYDARKLRRILWKKFKFIPRRRKDIDAILLVAFPKDARQIRPLLKFYFAGDIPIYATSHIFSGVVRPGLDRDLNGINFCDMPWVLKRGAGLPAVLPALRKEIIKLWPSSYKRYSRLYALGIDSYYLMLNSHTLFASPSAGIDGATGMFYLDRYGHIYRKLSWAKFINGRPYSK